MNPQLKARNSDSEIRKNSEARNSKCRLGRQPLFSEQSTSPAAFGFASVGFVSNFGFRISNLQNRAGSRNHGAAYILAVILLALFAAMAAGLAATTDMNARLAQNTSQMQHAQLAAESALAFGLHTIRDLILPSTTTLETAMGTILTSLQSQLNGSANLTGHVVYQQGNTIYVPRIDLGTESIELQVEQAGDRKLYLKAYGFAGTSSRGVRMEMILDTPKHTVFDYGLASRGQISVSGNSEIRGKNALTEASVISTSNGPVAISVGGSAVIDGDLSSVGTDTTIVISGNPTIAGSQNPQVIAEHVHFGVAAPAFPEVDTSIFRALAVNVIDRNTDTSQKGAVFNNVLIKANTNPTFSGDVTLNGVVYIEAPNIVSFTSKVTLNGLVATDASAYPLTSCKLNFEGQVEAFGVEALPNLPQYTAVKALSGTFIAAPGFDVSFAGQFSTINGTVAADKLTFSGQAYGTIRGSVIGLSQNDTDVKGTVDIIIDRSGIAPYPPGFKSPLVLKVQPETYSEINGI